MPQTCQLAHYAIAIVDSFMSLLTVLVNGLILLVATRTGHFNCSHGYFSVSLAVADLIVGLITEPCMVYNHFKQGNRNLAKREEYEDWYCNVTGFFTNVSLCASLLTLISSSGFRYFVIGRPLSYWNSRRKLKKYVLRIILITWIFSVIFGLVPIVIPYDHYWIHFVGMTLSVKMDELYIYHMTLTIGLISLWVLTLSLWIKIKRFSTLRLQQLSQTSTYRTTRETVICSFLRSIIIVFTICYLPLIITQSFASLQTIDLRNFPKSFDVVSNYIWNVFMFLSSSFVLGNSFANFFVYVFEDREFTNALLRATGML
ncbi:uncharacterized protein LOC143459849 [Clavelina lepadiformis]|uniref:uncharacterized protein LOC143459849 n=1 Tax=Clavelina lepadiformis TaxID=159417 RepID=UPI0040411885